MMTNTIDINIDMDENNYDKNVANDADSNKNIGNESVKDQENNAIMDDKEDVVISDKDIVENITVVKDSNDDSNTIPNNMKLEENDTEKEINTNVELGDDKISKENHTITEIDINTTMDCTVEETDTKTEICENIIDENHIITDDGTPKNKTEDESDTDNHTPPPEITTKDNPGKECDVDKDEIKVDVKTDTTMNSKDISDFVNDDDDKAFKRYRLRQRTTKSYIDNEPPPSKKKKINKKDVETEVNLSCDECYQSFDTKRGYSCHMAHHNQPEKFTCAQCSMEFLTNKELRDHKKVHDGEQCIFTCGQCKVAYSSNLEYLLHKVEHKPKHFKCEECGKLCMKTQMLTYKDHLFSHFNDTYKCDVCQKNFKTRQCYLKHVKLHDANSKKTSYLCGECGKDCKDKQFYDYHMSSHTGVKVYQCLYCGIGFSNAGQRKTHTQRIHTNERPFKCPMCDLTFKQAVDVKSHIGNKHNEQKFQCTICKKEYKQKNSLMFHMRIHTKKDLIPCPSCDEKFTIPANLKAHYVYRHTNEKPFQCDVCNMAFKVVGALRRHLKSQTHKNNAYGVEAKRKKLETNN